MSQSTPLLWHVHPSNWWAGMAHPELQILLHGKRISHLDVVLANAHHLELKEVVRFPNKNYLLLYIDTQEAPPQTFTIQLKQEGKVVLAVPYELKLRNRKASPSFDAGDVVYLLMPDRFAMGESYKKKRQMYAGLREDTWNRRQPYSRHGGDLRGIVNHLDYLQDLGITTLWLTPVQVNDMAEQSYHGYAITDYYEIDPRLGTKEDYCHLVEEAHHRGIKVVMDMVFNHCGTEHFLYRDPPTDNWFSFNNQYVQTAYRTSTPTDVHATLWDKRLTTEGWFTRHMPDLNGKNPYLADYLIQMTKWWTEYTHIDGFRQDTYPYNDFDLMKRWCHEMEEQYPGMNLVGETWMSDNVGISCWQKDSKLAAPLNSELKTVMDFPLTFLMGAAVDEETDEWFNGLARLYAYLSQDVVYADVNHLLTFLSNHDIDRFQPTETKAANLTRYKQALTLLLTLRGIPQLYVGDEIGMYGIKGDNDGLLRKDFPGGFPRDKQNAFSSGSRTQQQNEYFCFTQQLLHWRKENKAVAYGRLVHFPIRCGCYVYARMLDEQTVTIILNGTGQAQRLDLTPYSEVLPQKKMYDVISKCTISLRKTLLIEPRGIVILTLP